MDTDKVIKFAGEAGFGGNQRNTLLVKLMAFAHRVEREEREACAKVCDRFHERMMLPAECAAAIRMRYNVEDEK